MELRNLAIFLGLAVLAVSQCSEGRHSMHRERRDTDYDDVFAADEASDDEQTLNDEDEDSQRSPEPAKNQIPEVQGKIITQPMVFEVKKGDDVILPCQIESQNGSVVVTQWYKDGNLYFMNQMKTNYDIDLSRFSVNDDKNLNITAVQASDAGVYKCELVQDNIVSIEHTLVVLESPQIVRLTASNDGRVVEGEDLLLTCEVIGRPPPQILWARSAHGGNQRLTERDGRFSHNSLFIQGVKREHSGNYYCYVFNNLGNDTKGVQVDISGKPHVHVHRPVINSAVGVPAILECSTRYDANPHIRWYKDGKLIEDSGTEYTISTRESNSNLTITPKKDEDFGTFTCEAENNIGKHNRSIELVQRPVVESLAAEDGRLTWTVHSHRPLVEIWAQLYHIGQDGAEWKKFDIPLPSTWSHRYELTFDLNDKQLEAGKYQAFVKVRNDLNDQSWSEDVDPVILEIDVEPSMSIQHASVYRGNAHSVSPSSVVLSSFLMYLLVRML